MSIEIFLVLFVTAIAATAVVIFAASRGGIAGVDIQHRSGIILSAVVFVLWGLVAVNSFEIVVHSGGQEFTRSYEQLGWLAVLGGAIGLYSMLQATIAEIKQTGGV